MNDNKRAMVMASFAADSLALGVHWIYDTRQIAETCGRVSSFLKPGPDSYHPTKDTGDFTHYGDQTLVLLESLAARKAFDLRDFSDRWRSLFENYDGYVDGATRKTLAYYAKGKGPETAGSRSVDFAGATRIAPLVYLLNQDIEKLVTAARAQTKMTHNDPNTVDAAEFFARVTVRVLEGTAPVQALQEVVSSDTFELSPIAMWVEQGLKSVGQDSVSTIGRFGQACEITQAFSGVIHLIATYENDLKEALIQAVMAGGDSAARGIMVGMVLGAHLGMAALPAEWVSAISKRAEILALLEQLP